MTTLAFSQKIFEDIILKVYSTTGVATSGNAWKGKH